jgi:hypothetical protein
MTRAPASRGWPFLLWLKMGIKKHTKAPPIMDDVLSVKTVDYVSLSS